MLKKLLTMNNQYICILSDYGFKAVFGDEGNTLFLRKTIQILCQFPNPDKKVIFKRIEVDRISPKSRGGLNDLVCANEDGRVYIFEMQRGHFKQFIQRAKFYACYHFQTLIKAGNQVFKDIPPIYSISILEQNIINSEGYYHICQLKNQNDELIDVQNFHIIVELGKFNKKPSEITTDRDKLFLSLIHI